ncbi:tol-pal system YbgF family protein [Micromonospora orduensis]|uniref:tetratricopeptide repeat protein n=1 Tax=Micromonospora orduensis TaxID=1420891 RepID=UPI0036265CFE
MTREEDRELLTAAYEAWESEDWPQAGELLERLARRHPDHPRAGVWWYDAALAYKFLRNWAKAYELGREAAARADRDAQDPAFWNLGIAATIMEDWATARDAWRGFGVGLPDGEGEIVEDLGPGLVRLNPTGNGEVVWARRLCPTRARVLNVPTPESGRRFGEIVVHDGAPNGRREVDGRSYPVFDELLLWRESPLPTSVVHVVAADADDVRALVALFEERDYGAEPWSSIEMICTCCSEDSLSHDGDHTVAGDQRVSLAAPVDEIPGLLARWRAAAPQRRSWTDLVTG